MNNRDSKPSQVAKSWDTYWQGTGDVGAYSSGGVNHPLILAFWDDFFSNVKQQYPIAKIIDIASGNGAVLERALAAFDNQQADITCLDVSQAAINNIRERFPEVQGVVADAQDIPLNSGGYNIAISQFGVEYAGIDAIYEVARLVSEGGQLALMLHTREGSIHQECSESLDAIVRLQESKFIPYASEMFDAGFKAVQGANRVPYDEAAMKLAPALSSLEDIMRQYGQQVAGGTISRLYNDVGQIHERIQHYESDEILTWLNQMNDELDAYAERMSSMHDSAIDQPTFEQVCENLRERGLSIVRAEPLTSPDQDLPLAWILAAKRSSVTSQII